MIPEIGGLPLDTLMQACLSKQISLKETQETELRKRTAAEQFIIKTCEHMAEAQRAMQNDKIGKMFDPHQGYVSWKADPDNLIKEITKEYQIYQKEQIITEDCKLVGQELINRFFAKVDSSLKLAINNKQKTLFEEYQKARLKISFFDKAKLKSQYRQAQIEVKNKYQQSITEMQLFKKVIEPIGAKHIKIFAGEPGQASYSMPKPLVDATTKTPEVSPRLFGI